MSQKQLFGAIILAGGRSSRFGRDKSLLKIDGITIVADNIRRWEGLFSDIIIVSNSAHKLDIAQTREISDLYPGCGPLGGLHAGLCAAKYAMNLLTACDMPYLNRDLISLLLAQAAQSAQADIVACRYQGKVEPLCALYHQRCAALAERLLRQGQRSMMGLHDRCRVSYVEVEEALFNINTQEDAA
ncbi:MAG: molybdenum cofactor guanylyltransferase, partial [Clostridiales bacterium]